MLNSINFLRSFDETFHENEEMEKIIIFQLMIIRQIIIIVR